MEVIIPCRALIHRTYNHPARPKTKAPPTIGTQDPLCWIWVNPCQMETIEKKLIQAATRPARMMQVHTPAVLSGFHSLEVIFWVPESVKARGNSSINGGRRVFLTRLPGGRRLFVTYQWGKPQLDEVENAEGASVPRR